MLLYEILNADKLFRITYYTGSKEHSRIIQASSKKAAVKEVSKLGRVHKILAIPSGYGRAVDALN